MLNYNQKAHILSNLLNGLKITSLIWWPQEETPIDLYNIIHTQKRFYFLIV